MNYPFRPWGRIVFRARPDPVRLIRGYTGLVGGRKRCGWSLVLAVMNTRVGVSSLMARAMGSAIRFGCFLRLVCVCVVLGWCWRVRWECLSAPRKLIRALLCTWGSTSRGRMLGRGVDRVHAQRAFTEYSYIFKLFDNQEFTPCGKGGLFKKHDTDPATESGVTCLRNSTLIRPRLCQTKPSISQPK
jgi:hypothetical protein